MEGICQCGNSTKIVCDIDSPSPFCHLGSCLCSKSRDAFLLGDGTTRGSCHSRSERCQADGLCKQCSDSSQCTGLSDTCGPNFTCGCGENGPPCNGTLSNRCEQGVCKCGDQDQCASSNYLDTANNDPKTEYLKGLGLGTDDPRYVSTILNYPRKNLELFFI